MATPGPLPLLQTPPLYCQYAGGPCDQNFDDVRSVDAVFLYPGQPEIIASTIETAIKTAAANNSTLRLRSWRDFNVAGHIIFCEIGKAIRGAAVVFADITTLNFNLLFEIGYAIGLGVPVIPIKDRSYTEHEREFAQLGLIDTYGYLNFANADELAAQILEKVNAPTSAFGEYSINQEQPLFLVKSPIATEGQIKLVSTLDKSGIAYRTFDPQETARISLHEAVRSVMQSHGVVASLLAPERAGALVNNARCAFICGIAMAAQRVVLMAQENEAPQPIDYRDVIKSYTSGSRVPNIVAPFVKALVQRLQGSKYVPVVLPLTELEKVDFGDLAAENEANHLLSYFVATGEYTDVKRGRARLVVGRKGSGKTAIFYGVIEAYHRSKSFVVLEIKPEAHQFTEFRELILKKLEQGAKEHVLTAFWHYLLLVELVHKIVETEGNLASRDHELAALYQRLSDLYGYEPAVEEGDFSERLFDLMERIKTRRRDWTADTRGDQVTEIIYEKDIAQINEALADYLSHKDGIWILVDNLDKGWPVGGIEPEDILLIQSLLEATRKIQKQLSKRNVDTHAVVFLRNDVFDLLLPQIKDKGKDPQVFLDWTDREAFKELVQRRMSVSTGIDAPFEDLWAMFFESHVDGEESFAYILSRTLLRPRDLIRFLRDCVSVAITRRHERILEDDIKFAENGYSEDQLQELSFELRQIFPEYGEVLYILMGEPAVLPEARFTTLLSGAGVPEERWRDVVDVLLWFGLIGFVGRLGSEHYAYEYRYGIERVRREAVEPAQYVVHPAFRKALGTQ